MALIQAKRREQQALGNGQAFDGRFACNHVPILGLCPGFCRPRVTWGTLPHLGLAGKSGGWAVQKLQQGRVVQVG